MIATTTRLTLLASHKAIRQFSVLSKLKSEIFKGSVYRAIGILAGI